MNTPPTASPCTGVCRIDDQSGCCIGCLRKIDEIVAWASYSEADKRRVWALLPQRREQLGSNHQRFPPVKGAPS
ncbi:DUF1289 domain-containing protein [Piscinibacter sakaiensis]|uniref:DUF1289 domain-containing protein n=1 Tax=Piscinibacter sakaiensis TaxID=1547922 RepID=UPI003AABF72E